MAVARTETPLNYFGDRQNASLHAQYLRASEVRMGTSRSYPPLFPIDASVNPTDFSVQRARFMGNFLANYPEAMEVWQQGGLLDPQFQNIARHSAMAGVYADIFCDLLGIDAGKPASEQYERQAIIRAALVHDWYKAREITAIDSAFARNGVVTKDDLQAIKEADERELVALGMPQVIARLAGANVPSPHPTKAGGELPHSLGEAVVWFVDAMLYDETPVAIHNRLTAGRLVSEYGGARRGRRNDALNDALASLYDMPYYDVQMEIGRNVGAILAQALKERHPHLSYLEGDGLQGGESTIPWFLERELQRRVRNNARISA